jgi:hypothetical protein
MLTRLITPQGRPVRPLAGGQKELSGSAWTRRFLGSTLTSSLSPRFRASVDAFVTAMRDAHIRVIISATYRPPERSYLMHWSWKIVHGTNPAAVPSLPGVDIEWVHPAAAASLEAAKQMVHAFDMGGLHTPPALRSLHNERQAIDMTIGWNGTVTITDARGAPVRITSLPRTGMNRALQAVGASYGVTKFIGGESDKPHWSTTGR